jgi:putative oxidoreductase
MILRKLARHSFWQTYALVVARLLMGGMFLLAAYYKFADINMTAGYIASVGIPYGVMFAWIAGIAEAGIGISFITGACFREAALFSVAYIIFLTAVFHGPATWTDQTGIGLFIDHLTLIAGLLFMVAHGPGETWVTKGWMDEQG